MKKNKLLAVLVISVMILASLAACNIDLNAVKINIKTPATKTVYEIGEEFTAKGLVVEAEDANGLKTAMTDDLYKIESGNFDNTKAGEYTIVIKLKADETKTVEYSVTVLAPNVVASIAIKSESTYKSVYEIGEEFNYEGLIVEKVMSRGNRVTCLAIEFSVNSIDFDNMVSGKYSIIVTLTDDATKTVSYDITVSAAKPSSISLKMPATKLTYEIDDEFLSVGLVIEKLLTDGNTTACGADEFIVDSTAFDNTRAGSYKIVIKLKADETKTVEYSVTVLAPNVVASIAIKSESTYKSVYEIGEEFNYEGLIVEKTMSRDGAKELCETDDYIIDSTAFNSTKAGEYTIVIKLKADETKTVEYSVTVLAPNVVASIAIKSESTYKSVYEIGEEFNYEGLIVEKIMSRDGAKELCETNDYIIDSTAFDNTRAGSYKIVIKLKADETKMVEYSVTVNAVAEYVGKYQYEDYKSEQIALSLDILADGTAISYLHSTYNDSTDSARSGEPLLYTYKVTPYSGGGFFLEFTFARHYYENSGVTLTSQQYFSGVYSDGIFTVSNRFFMQGEHSKVNVDFKLLEVVFLGNSAACYYFTDEFTLDSTLFGLAGLIDAGSIGIYTDAECTVLVDASKSITANTTLYIEKIANLSVDKSYYGTYVQAFSVNEETNEIILGLQYFVGDAITHGDMTMNYVVTKVDDAYLLSMISFNNIFDTISIRFDETLNSYVLDMGDSFQKIDMSKYAVVSLDGTYDFGFSQFVILKGNPISKEFLGFFDVSLSYTKDDEATIYNGEPITEDIILYICKNVNSDLLVGKQFSAGDYGTISFSFGNRYYLNINNQNLHISGTYKSVLSDNKYTITLSLEDSDTTYALGIYDIELGTLVITLSGEEITYRLPKYAGHAFFINSNHSDSSRFRVPIVSQNEKGDYIDIISIYFDIFGYVSSNNGVVGTYEIFNNSIGGKYNMTVNFGENWNPSPTTVMTGHYDAVTNRVVLNDNIYYTYDNFRFHPLIFEGLTSVNCYDEAGNSFSLWWDGTINVQLGSKHYSLCTDITLVEKGVYELKYEKIYFRDENGGPVASMTKIVANIFDKTFTVTIGNQDYVFAVPPYGRIVKYLESPFVYENHIVMLDIFGNYVYTLNEVNSYGTFTAIEENSKIIFKFYDDSKVFLYDAYIDKNSITLFVTINGEETAFLTKVDKPDFYPELFGTYVSDAGQADVVVLEITDGYSFNITVNEVVMHGSYEVFKNGNKEYEFTGSIDSGSGGRIQANYSNGILTVKIWEISYSLTKEGGSGGGEQTAMSFMDKVGNQVFMQSDMSCQLMLGGNKYNGSYSLLGQQDGMELYEFQIDKDTVITVMYDGKSMILSFTYLDVQYDLSYLGEQVNPSQPFDSMFKDNIGNEIKINSYKNEMSFYVNGTSEKGAYEKISFNDYEGQQTEIWNLYIANSTIEAILDINNNILSFSFNDKEFVLYLNGDIPKI